MNIGELLGEALRYLGLAKDEARLVVFVIKDNGLRHFGRPLALGGGAVLFAYALVYLPANSRVARLAKKVQAAKAAVKYADDYKDMSEKLARFYATAPAAQERNSWLVNRLVDSMKAEGVTSDSIPMPKDREQSGFIIQQVDVAVPVRFPQLVSWLDRLELSKPLLQVDSIELQKTEDNPGANMVVCGVSAVLPARDAGP